MANLNIKVTADTRTAQSNLNALTSSIHAFARELQNTTPQQVALSRAFDQVQQSFNAGKISLEEARTRMQGLAAEAQNLGGKLQESGGKTEGFVGQWTELKSQLDITLGVIQAVGVAADKAFDFAKLGGQVNQMSESFDLLVESVGAAPDLFEQLKEAAGGTISDLTLMASTSKLLAGTSGELATAMADAAPRLLEVARAAVKLDPTLGSVEEVFQSLATGIKRNSPLLIDNANIVVKLGTANEKLAEQLGKTVEEFTDSEKAMALLNATLDGGDKLIAQVGGTVESQTDAFSQFETSVTNLTNSFAGLVAATGLVQEPIENLGGQFDAWSMILQALNDGLITGGEAFMLFNQAALGAEAANTIIEYLGDKMKYAALETLSFSDALQDHAAHVGEAENGYDALGEGMGNLEDHYANQHIALKESIDDFDAQADAQEKAEQRMRKWNDAAAQAIELAQNAKAPIEEMIDSLDQDIGSPLEDFISDLNFFIATGGADFVGALEGIQSALADNAITEEQALTYSGALLAAFENAKIAAGEIDFDEAAENLASSLGIPVEDAETLLTKFTNLSTVTDALSKGIQMNIQAENLDATLEAAGNLEEGLVNLDNFTVAPVFQTEGIDGVTTSLGKVNERAMEAEESVSQFVDSIGTVSDEAVGKFEDMQTGAGQAVEEFENLMDAAKNTGQSASELEPLAAGLDGVAGAGRGVVQVIAELEARISQLDLSQLEPFIAHSPPPLGEGLDYIANAIPAVVSGFNMLAQAAGGDLPGLPSPSEGPLDPGGMPTPTGGLLDLHALFEVLIQDAENYADALFDAAGAFGGLADTAAGLFEEQTLDPLKSELEGIDARIAAILEGETGDMYELARLTEERAAKAAEIAEQEERILRLQEQQQKLDFLRQQFELIQFLQENGLNPADFLGGVDLGAEADPAALVDAMSAALEQILAQLGGELGGLGFANGADFVVPPGYPGDSFGPMWATTGEHVSVSRPGEGGGGMTVQISMAGAIIMSQQEADRMMKSALDRVGSQADIYRRGGR
jgi:hypothetical protein